MKFRHQSIALDHAATNLHHSPGQDYWLAIGEGRASLGQKKRIVQSFPWPEPRPGTFEIHDNGRLLHGGTWSYDLQLQRWEVFSDWMDQALRAIDPRLVTQEVEYVLRDARSDWARDRLLVLLTHQPSRRYRLGPDFEPPDQLLLSLHARDRSLHQVLHTTAETEARDLAGCPHFWIALLDRLEIWRKDDGQPLVFDGFGAPAVATLAACAERNALLVMLRAGALWRLELETGDRQLLATERNGWRRVVLLPGGRHYLVEREGWGIGLVDAWDPEGWERPQLLLARQRLGDWCFLREWGQLLLLTRERRPRVEVWEW